MSVHVLQCFGVTDGSFVDHTQEGFVSGRGESAPTPPAPPSPAVPTPPSPTPPPTPTPTPPVWPLLVADLSEVKGLVRVAGLRANGNRLTRARYPNVANIETVMSSVALNGWVRDKTTWLPPAKPAPAPASAQAGQAAHIGPMDATPLVEVSVGPLDWPGVEWPMNETGGQTKQRSRSPPSLQAPLTTFPSTDLICTCASLYLS
jgi:hypothetical protein